MFLFTSIPLLFIQKNIVYDIDNLYNNIFLILNK